MGVMSGIFRHIVYGASTRGSGGFLYVKGDECAYMFPHELQRQHDMQTVLEEMLQNDAENDSYIVVEERDGKLHMLAYEKARVLQEVLKEHAETDRSAAATEASPPPEPAVDATVPDAPS